MAEKLLDLRGVSMAFGGLAVVERPRPARRRGRDRERHRPERRRQDDALQPHHRDLRADGRRHPFAGESIKGLDPAPDHAQGDRADVPDAPPLPQHDRAGERDGGGLRPHERRPGRSIFRTPGQRREEREIRALAEERLAFFGDRLMGYRWDQPAYSLSYANRRRLEIARATATNPRLLLLDEPAAGMNPKETQEITDLIGKLRQRAATRSSSSSTTCTWWRASRTGSSRSTTA